jgi:hypothetical protein
LELEPKEIPVIVSGKEKLAIYFEPIVFICMFVPSVVLQM